MTRKTSAPTNNNQGFHIGSIASIEQKVKTRYTVPLTGPIGEIHEYGEFVHILSCATEWDDIYIQLSSPGGSLETCDYLCRRMDECEAKITVEIGFTCASVASAIALQADDWVIYDSSTMTLQSCRYSPGYGKESDIRASAAYMERVNLEWIKRTYQGFLTEAELMKILDDGKDVYFFADDLRERTIQYKEYRIKSKAREIEEILKYWESKNAA